MDERRSVLVWRQINEGLVKYLSRCAIERFSTKYEAARVLIRKDNKARETYERIRTHAGAKLAIVAAARRLLLKTRRMIINDSQFARCA